jgi:hypothetical protein
MDITLENITDLELPAELETALLGKLEPKIPTFLTGKNFVVKPKADYDNEFNNAVAAKNKEAIDEEGARLYGSIDNILKLLGMPKPAGVTRTRDHVLNLAAEGKLPLTKEQFETMKKKLEAKGATEAQANDAVEDLKTKIEEIENSGNKKDSDSFTKSVNRDIKQSLKDAPVRVDPDLKEESAKTAAKTSAINDINAIFKTYYEGVEIEDTGEIGYRKKGTTAILMNAEGEPMTPIEIIKKNHGIYLAPQNHQQTGGGTKGGNTGGKSESPAGLTLKDILVAAAEKGLKTNTPEWRTYVNAEKKTAGIK